MNDDPVFLTVADVLGLHVEQIREFGGSEGLRDEGGLEFVDYWEVPIVTGTKYWALAGVRREGDVYVIISMGLAELAVLLGEREKISSVSSALEQGRAGLLRPSNYTGELLGYEVDGPSYPANIRVQLLGAGSSFFAGVDASVDGLLDASLAEIDGALL